VQVWVVSLLFRDSGGAVYPVERREKVREFKAAFQVMVVDNRPSWQLLGESLDFGVG